MLTALQALPRDAELLAFEAGYEDYYEREAEEVEWQGGRVYLHLAPAGTTRHAARRPYGLLTLLLASGYAAVARGSGRRWAATPAWLWSPPS
jgi:hypothetical protein